MRFLKPAILFAFVFVCASVSYSNTNDAIMISNIIIHTSITNTRYSVIHERELPNSFLRTGRIEFTEPETTLRRLDITYFIAIPITYYLMYNIMLLKNQYLYNVYYGGIDEMDKVDKLFIYVNTLMIPLFTAYNDYIYIEMRKVIDNEQSTDSEVQFGFRFMNARF